MSPTTSPSTTARPSTTPDTACTERPRRILVVGNGMAGARLAEELRHRDPCGERLHVTVVGEEPHAAYNRVLLSSVVAGSLTPRETRLKPDGWWAARGIRVVTGVRVTSVDLAARTATLTPTPPASPHCPPNTAFVPERTGMPLSSEANAAFTPRGVGGTRG
ncbi:FAD-dependent oxidoreductase, partial [Intrasporangium oryzae]|uniref:FAD-dependent oxidoreductase n=1 Tax=Intrasporangium oryzae TaxID=412687 RepID=UPI00055282A2